MSAQELTYISDRIICAYLSACKSCVRFGFAVALYTWALGLQERLQERLSRWRSGSHARWCHAGVGDLRGDVELRERVLRQLRDRHGGKVLVWSLW